MGLLEAVMVDSSLSQLKRVSAAELEDVLRQADDEGWEKLALWPQGLQNADRYWRNFFFTACIAIFGAYLISHAESAVAQSPPDPFVGRLVEPVLLRGVEDVHIVGDYAYLPCREGERLTICSIADPANPTVISSFTHPQLKHAAGFAIHDDTIYLASQSNQRLLVVDAADKSALRLLGSVRLGESEKGVLYKVAYRAGHCYVAHQTEKKLFVVDVRAPSHPVVVGSVAVTTGDDGPFSVMLHGNYALVGTIFGNRNRLAVVDIEDPAKPRLHTQVFDPAIGQISGEIVGDLYFTANWDRNAFLVFDVSDPSNPKLAAKLVDERLGKPNRCVVAGDRAYLPMVQGDGVAVVDIADPMNPKFLTSFQDPVLKKTYGVAFHDGLLFVGAREGNSLVVMAPGTLE